MSEAPLVSVIIPVYNGDQYIRACLENMFTQSYKNLEIIVVDDGSTDRSVEIAKEYPTKILRQENKGVSAARNAGMYTSQGEFIHFMDVDDSINTDYYQQMVTALVQTDAEMACSGMINQRNKYQTNSFKKLRVYQSVPEKLKATYVGRLGYVWRYLFRTEFLKQHNLCFEEGRIIEDMMFSLPAVYFAKQLVVVPRAIYTYTYRKDSQLNHPGEEQQAKRDTDWQHAEDFRRRFAEQHHFKIPGVDTGKWAYRWRKFKNSLGW